MASQAAGCRLRAAGCEALRGRELRFQRTKTTCGIRQPTPRMFCFSKKKRPFLCPGSKVSSCEGTPGPSLGGQVGPPAGAYTTAVDDRRLPPAHWGSAGAEHPEGGLLDGFCLIDNKQAPRKRKKKRRHCHSFRTHLPRSAFPLDRCSHPPPPNCRSQVG
jgi:hypothetical protein